MDYEPPPAFSLPQQRLGPMQPGGMVPPMQPGGMVPPMQPGGMVPPAGPTPAPPHRPMSATATVVAISAVVVAALAVVAIVVLFRASGSGPQHRISLPDSAGGYRLVRTVDGQTAEAMLGSAASSLGPISSALAVAKIGLYGTGGADALPTVIFLGFNRADSAAIDALMQRRSADQVTGELLDGTASAPPRSFDTGPLGGSLKCASAARGATSFTPCAWVDASTIGLLLRVGTVDEGAMADLTLSFRTAAEH